MNQELRTSSSATDEGLDQESAVETTLDVPIANSELAAGFDPGEPDPTAAAARLVEQLESEAPRVGAGEDTELGERLGEIWYAAVDTCDPGRLRQAGDEILAVWDEMAADHVVFDTLRAEAEHALAERPDDFATRDLRARILEAAAVVQERTVEAQMRFGSIVDLHRYRGAAVTSQLRNPALGRAHLARRIDERVAFFEQLDGLGAYLDTMIGAATESEALGAAWAWADAIRGFASPAWQFSFVNEVMRAVPVALSPDRGLGASTTALFLDWTGATNAFDLYVRIVGGRAVSDDQAAANRQRQMQNREDRENGIHLENETFLAQQAADEARAQADAIEPPADLGEMLAQVEQAQQIVVANVDQAGPRIAPALEAARGARAILEDAGADYSSAAQAAIDAVAHAEEGVAVCFAAREQVWSRVPDAREHPAFEAAEQAVSELLAEWESGRNELLMCFSVQRFRGDPLLGSYSRPTVEGPLADWLSARAEHNGTLLAETQAMTTEAAEAFASYDHMVRAAGSLSTRLSAWTGMDWLFLHAFARTVYPSAVVDTVGGRSDALLEASAERRGVDSETFAEMEQVVDDVRTALDDGLTDEDAQDLVARIEAYRGANREEMLSLLVQHNLYDRFFHEVHEQTEQGMTADMLRTGRFAEGAYTPEQHFDGTLGGALEYAADATQVGMMSAAYGMVESLPILGEAVDVAVGEDVNAFLFSHAEYLGLAPDDAVMSITNGRVVGVAAGTLGQAGAGGTANLILEGAELVESAYTGLAGETLFGQDVSGASQGTNLLGAVSSIAGANARRLRRTADTLVDGADHTADALTDIDRLMARADRVDRLSRAVETGTETVEYGDAIAQATLGYSVLQPGEIGDSPMERLQALLNLGAGRAGGRHRDVDTTGDAANRVLDERRVATSDGPTPDWAAPLSEDGADDTSFGAELASLSEQARRDYAEEPPDVFALAEAESRRLDAASNPQPQARPGDAHAEDGHVWHPQPEGETSPRVEAMNLYWEAVDATPDREVAVVEHMETGELRVVQGDATSVRVDMGPEWSVLRHYHPPRSGETDPEAAYPAARRLPSIGNENTWGDMRVMLVEAQVLGMGRVSNIDMQMPDGTRAQTRIGYDPETARYFIDWPRPDGTRDRQEFDSIEAVERHREQETGEWRPRRPGETLELPAVPDGPRSAQVDDPSSAADPFDDLPADVQTDQTRSLYDEGHVGAPASSFSHPDYVVCSNGQIRRRRVADGWPPLYVDEEGRIQVRAGASQAQRARRSFARERPRLQEELDVDPGGQVHHALELKVLDLFPGVFSEGELNGDANMRGVHPETTPTGRNHARTGEPTMQNRWHNSAVRRFWDRAYRDVQAALDAQGLSPGDPGYAAFVRARLEEHRAQLDAELGFMWSGSLGPAPADADALQDVSDLLSDEGEGAWPDPDEYVDSLGGQ